MPSRIRIFPLPDLLSSCPLKDATNPHYREAGAESRAWINSYNIFTDRKRAFFIQGSNELLCSHVYAYANYEEFRTTCDFVNLLFVLDEISDDQDGKDARATGCIFVNVMRDPEWDDGSVLATITREFRARFVRFSGPRNLRRFLKLCEEYTNGVAREAELREEGTVLDLESFTNHRRHNSAVLLCFALVESLLGIDLSDEAYEDPTFMQAYWAACDHVCWANDVYSYDMEQAKGHTGNNIVTLLMKEKHMSLAEASEIIGRRCQTLLDQYLASKAKLAARTPSHRSDELRFIEALGHWVIGNLVWSFETVRYFGARHLEVKETLVVHLRPCGIPEDSDSESDSGGE